MSAPPRCARQGGRAPPFHYPPSTRTPRAPPASVQACYCSQCKAKAEREGLRRIVVSPSEYERHAGMGQAKVCALPCLSAPPPPPPPPHTLTHTTHPYPRAPPPPPPSPHTQHPHPLPSPPHSPPPFPRPTHTPPPPQLDLACTLLAGARCASCSPAQLRHRPSPPHPAFHPAEQKWKWTVHTADDKMTIGDWLMDKGLDMPRGRQAAGSGPARFRRSLLTAAGEEGGAQTSKPGKVWMFESRLLRSRRSDSDHFLDTGCGPEALLDWCTVHMPLARKRRRSSVA